MSVSPGSFLIELYEDYLEEASFLYEQRSTLFSNPGITWKRIGEFEERFDAHIDGLVVGGDLALDLCERQAAEGDAGEKHAAVRVFCRRNRKDLFLKAWEGLDAASTPAMADALKHELPESWQPDLIDFLKSADPKLSGLAVEVAGYRRLKAESELKKLLEKSGTEGIDKTVWALGRIGGVESREMIRRHLLEGTEPVRAAAALSLLRLHDDRTISYCQQQVKSEPWAIFPLTLGGGRVVHEILLDKAAAGAATAECLDGLGRMGYLAAVPILINYLDQADLASFAARALDRITGARLQEHVFIPDDFEEDELFAEEKENLKQGRTPTRPDGKPYGSQVNRLSQKKEDWQMWWSKRERAWDKATRYRNGAPYSAACLLSDLEQESTPHEARRQTYEELVIRFGLDVPFEADMFVADQKKALKKAMEWSQHVGASRS